MPTVAPGTYWLENTADRVWAAKGPPLMPMPERCASAGIVTIMSGIRKVGGTGTNRMAQRGIGCVVYAPLTAHVPRCNVLFALPRSMLDEPRETTHRCPESDRAGQGIRSSRNVVVPAAPLTCTT